MHQLHMQGKPINGGDPPRKKEVWTAKGKRERKRTIRPKPRTDPRTRNKAEIANETKKENRKRRIPDRMG